MSNLDELLNVLHLDKDFSNEIIRYINYSETTDSIRRTYVMQRGFPNLKILYYLCLNKGKSIFDIHLENSTQIIMRKGVGVPLSSDYYENKRVHRGETLEGLKRLIKNSELDKIIFECHKCIYGKFNRSAKYPPEFSLEQLCEQAISVLAEFDYINFNIKKCLQEFLISKNLTYVLMACFLIETSGDKRMAELIMNADIFKNHKIIKKLKRK